MLDRTFFGDLLTVVGIIAQRSDRGSVDRRGLLRGQDYNPPQDPMSLLAASGLAKSFGAQDVFADVSLAIPRQGRIALVGANGAGKTSLLRILAGLDRQDAGQVHRARGVRLGYLPQETRIAPAREEDSAKTLWDLCLGALPDLRKQEVELARLEAAMTDSQRAEDAIARYGPLQEAFDRAGGYTYPARIRRVLRGLGFTEDEITAPLFRLSGGERTRADLARLLLEDPDLLLLDEPTNHLDLQAIEWLEGWLEGWPGAAVIVSHDRYFLDHSVETVWELDGRKLVSYHGNYSAYAGQRADRRRLQASEYRAQQNLVHREQDYIRRNIAGQNSRQAQGRQTRLERMLQQETVSRPQAESNVLIDFGRADRSGDLVLQTRGLAVGYTDAAEPLFHVPDLALARGECVALIGPNGAGKTTFLKTLLRTIPPVAGEVQLGAALEIGYFAQAHEQLMPQRTVVEELLSVAPKWTRAQARDYLARFLFTGDSVDKRVEVLSGGERGRVALAKLALEGANLLLLDEPTNHLDLPSQEVLQAALAEFPGTILLVSHDRYLIDALATQIWEVSPEEHSLDVFVGGYADFVAARQRRDSARPTRPEKERSRPVVRSGDRQLRAELAAAEERIARLETELAEIARRLEQAGIDVDKVRTLGREYASIERDLNDEFSAWERLAQRGQRPA